MAVRSRQVREQIGEQFEQVLTAAALGAGWAAERLWRSLAPAVTGYLRVQGATEPDDLTSEVFVAVFRGLAEFSGDEQQFRSWVFTIAHHRLVDARRRAARRPAQVPMEREPGAAPATSPSASAEHEALARAGTGQVRALCERLAPDQRDVLLLRMVGGLTVEETAATLSKTPGAVKALQRRGLGALRRIFEREGVPL